MRTKKFLNEIEILVKDGHYQELGENPNMVLAWYLSKRTVDDFKGLVRRVQSGKFKPNKKNRELWDRFIDYFDIKKCKILNMTKREAMILALEVFAQSVDILIESDKVSRSIRTTKDYDLVNIAFYDLAESLQKKADRMKK